MWCANFMIELEIFSRLPWGSQEQSLQPNPAAKKPLYLRYLRGITRLVGMLALT